MGERSSITLNSKNYRIDITSYRGRDISDFSPRASTPGGGMTFSEMGLYQVLNQTDWRHGFGFNWHTDAAGYWCTDGNVETRIPGIVQLGSSTYLTDTGTAKYDRVWEGILGVYLSRRTGLATYDGLDLYTQPAAYGGSETLSTLPLGTYKIQQVWTNGLYDFVLRDNQRLVRIVSNTPVVTGATATGGAATYLEDIGAGYTDGQYTGYLLEITAGTGSGQRRWISNVIAATQKIEPTDNFSPAPDATSVYKIWDYHVAGINANCTDYSWMTSHDGFVYAGKDATNQVYYGSADDLSDLHGLVADDPTVIKVGKPGYPTLGAISYNGSLIIFKQDGLYKLDADRTAARKCLDYSDYGAYNSFTSWAIFNGTLVFGLAGHVYQWNGVRVSEITPPAISDSFPYAKYYTYNSLVTVGNYLFVLGEWGRQIDLICYDGVGWAKLTTFNYSILHYIDPRWSMIYRANYGSLVVATWHNNANNYPSISTLNRFFMSSYGLPDPNNFTPLPTTGTHDVITSRFDAGFRRVQKSTPSILVTAANISSGHYYIDVWYRINDGSWTAWGGSAGTTNRISTTGVTELKNPLGSAGGVSTIEYYWLQLKFVFVTDNTLYSPVLEDVSVRLLMRPNTDYGYTMNILAGLESEYAMGATDTRDPYTILSDLRTARNSKSPVDYIDPYGVSHKVYVSAVNELAVEEHVDDTGAKPNIEQQIQINLVTVEL